MALIEPVTAGGILTESQMRGPISSSRAGAISEAMLSWLRTDCTVSGVASGVTGYGVGICTGTYTLSAVEPTLSSIFASVGASGPVGQVLGRGIGAGLRATSLILLGNVSGVGVGTWTGSFISVSGVEGLVSRLRVSYAGRGMVGNDFELRSVATGVLSVMQTGLVSNGAVLGVSTIPVPSPISGVPLTARFI